MTFSFERNLTEEDLQTLLTTLAEASGIPVNEVVLEEVRTSEMCNDDNERVTPPLQTE